MKKDFIPAFRIHILTPCYDVVMRCLFGREFRKIANIINPQPHEKILDLGCGPGNVILELKKKAPQAHVTGLDIDPAILRIAERKFKKAGIDVPLIEASAAEIPGNEKYDTIVSTLMIHHLKTEEKRRMMHEAHRVLKPGGRMYLFDFGPPHGILGRILSRIYRHIEEIDDGVLGNYQKFMKEAGFKRVETVYRRRMLELLKAEK